MESFRRTGSPKHDIDWKRVAVIIMLLFLVVFLFNIFKFNIKASYSDSQIAKNRKLVESYQDTDVSTVEEQLAKAGSGSDSSSSSGSGSGSASEKAKYMKKFRGCIVVGDSVTEGLSLYGWLSDDQVFSKVGASILNGDSLFSKAAATYPKKAFFAFGMNDMGNYRGNAEAFTSDYVDLLQSFHKKSPKTKIYICGISTPSKKAQKHKKSIRKYKEFNAALKKMCKKHGYVYIDVHDILEKHPDLYAEDGIHADTGYYPYWLDRMAKKAGL
jgi:hypothetical protein